MTILVLNLLGEFEAQDGAGQTVRIGARKNRALLAALALAPAGALPRERIARLLWSDRADDQARSSLRQALAMLRKDLAVNGAEPIVANEHRVRLDLARTEVDAVTFQRLAVATEVEALRAAAKLYRGELLADIEIKDPAFEEWLRSERRRLFDLAAQVLERLWAEEAGAARLDAARRLVALDPSRESAHRKLMQSYAEAGERVLALRQYDICREMLDDEFGVAPDEETRALRDRVQSDLAGPAALAREAPAGDTRATGRPSVAVLPFDVITEEAELGAFSDGLTDDIITGLSRIKAIRVVARTTVLAFKGRPIDIRTLGRELECRYILEGSVRRREARLRISAQLIEAASGHHVWAERIDRAAADIFELQDEITAGIVASVQTQIILHEGRAAGEDRPESAARLLARSWQQFLGLTEASLATSRDLAERALSLDPGSGMAHRMLAVCLYHQAYMGFIPWTQTVIDDVFAHARLSVEAEDADEYSHWAMECAHLLRMEHARALRSLQQALEINPHCSLAHGSIGTVQAWSGQSDAAIRSHELALRMNSDDPTNFFRHLGLALAHYLASRYDEALSHTISVLHSRPHWWLGLLLNIASAAQLGRHDEARRMLAELERVRPGVTCRSLSILPFATERDRKHLLDGLRKAGMPEGA